MMHYWTIATFSCFLFAVKGDHDSTSRIRRSSNNGERDLAPIDDVQANGLKTYIVVYNSSNSTTLSTASTATYSMINAVGGQVISKYDTVLNGAAVTLTASAAEQLKKNPAIDFIVEDKTVSTASNSWGLDRIDQSDYPLDGKYRWENNINAGAGVNVCVSQIVCFSLFVCLFVR